MIESRVNGYLLVCEIENTAGYRGVDRCMWDFIDLLYYQQRLPAEIQELYEKVIHADSNGLWWPTSEQLETVLRLRDFTLENNGTCEAIAVNSPYFTETRSRADWLETCTVPLGIDVISVGEWSLIRALGDAGVLSNISSELALNENGLLEDASTKTLVENHYRALAERGVVEPIADLDTNIPVEAVEVFELAV